ncbi:hypothetical protein Patl1_04351 [Pistacia atlantica]|uniref:Uncharacterized protein n=1 Tax=Pistacia atlantica TaxID=434234 RepID=A0ACC1BS32_9ROSI|nr:hypothetical protein Patl1_04351 [Pistacia atlantica]
MRSLIFDLASNNYRAAYLAAHFALSGMHGENSAIISRREKFQPSPIYEGEIEN